MKLGLIITTFNRPQYLRQCLESIQRSDFSQVNTVLIVDDCSNDPDTRRLIDDFDLPGVELIKAFSKENRSIKGSLLFGCDFLFQTNDLVMNLDADAIVRKDFIKALLELNGTFPQHIITGFNCLTKNKNGSERHKVLTQGVGYNTKASVGGINMLFGKDQYYEWIRPALEICINTQGNWDHLSCLNSGKDGFAIICSVPSVVQHIGFESSMGHSAGGEPPDVADDFIDLGRNKEVMQHWEKRVRAAVDKAILKKERKFVVKNRIDGETFMATGDSKWEIIPSSSMNHLAGGEPPDVATDFENIEWAAWPEDIMPIINKVRHLQKLQLKNVTLIAVDDNIQGIIKAADISCKNIQFAAVKLLSSQDSDDPRAVKIRHLGSKKEYSQFILKEIVDYIDTPYFILFQADGFILRAEAWTDDFLKFDMVGAMWHFRDHKRTANGGFSCRSRRLHKILKEDNGIVLRNDHIITNFAEDHNICYIYREYLEEKYNMRVAPEELCEKFSIEAWGVKPPGNKYNGSLGFHGFGVDFNDANIPYKPYLLPNRQIL